MEGANPLHRKQGLVRGEGARYVESEATIRHHVLGCSQHNRVREHSYPY